MPLKPPTSPAAPSIAPAAPADADRQAHIGALAAPDPAVRRQAARALAGDGGAVAALCERLRHEDDVAVWDAILTSLAQTGDEPALRGLLGYLRADSAQLRNEVLETIKTFPPALILPRIETLLHDPDAHTRMAAIQLIQALGHPAGLEMLIAVLGRETEVNVAATAVDLLAEMGTGEAAPVLRQARQRFAGVPFLAFAIDTALARIGAGPE